MACLVWTPPASEDVARLRAFLAPKNRDAARRAVSDVRQGVKTLATHPEIGRAADARRISRDGSSLRSKRLRGSLSLRWRGGRDFGGPARQGSRSLTAACTPTVTAARTSAQEAPGAAALPSPPPHSLANADAPGRQARRGELAGEGGRFAAKRDLPLPLGRGLG